VNDKNILILGYDDFNLQELQTVENADAYHFIPLFHASLQEQIDIDVKALIEKAEAEIERKDREIHAIISFFDFPFTLLTFLLCEKYDLRGPTLEMGLKCEHKYWSRLEQQRAIPEHCPAFEAFDPAAPPTFEQLTVTPPLWVKPIKSFGSYLGFKVENKREFEESVETIHENIDSLAEPFNIFLEKADLPEEVRHIDGNYCLAEKAMSGYQCTISGYVQHQKVHIYGVVDSVHYENTDSFFYYLLPSKLPKDVQQRMEAISKRIMTQIGFDNSTFNIEFFYNSEKDEINLLEINPRMSQSHSDLYYKTYGHSNHQVLIKLALGEELGFEQLQGKYAFAAKFQYRMFEDGVVQKAPTAEKIKQLEHQYEDAIIEVAVEEGQRLLDLPNQDSYSYALAIVMLGADSEKALLEKYHQIIQKLEIKIN